MLLLFLQSGFWRSFVRFFIEGIGTDLWEETATSWVITALVVAVLIAGLSFGYKALRKAGASHHDQKIWSRGQTWLSFFYRLVSGFSGSDFSVEFRRRLYELYKNRRFA